MTDWKAVHDGLTELQKTCWGIAEKKGWHDRPVTLGEKMLLWHAEVSEAAEELRNGSAPGHIYHSIDTAPAKPEGVAVEAADVIIRILDDAEQFGIPVIEALLRKMEYNRSRSYRHGNKAF